MPIPNPYDGLPKSANKYRNYDKYMPQHPFRFCIIGPSGSGKTGLLYHMINECENFDKIYLYAKRLDEPLYEDLINRWQAVGNKYGLDLIEYSNDIADIINVDELDRVKQNLLIFDELIDKRNLKRVEGLFIRGRKENASLVFISQSYFEIAADNTTDIDKDKFMKIYREATSEPCDFLVIDLKTEQPDFKYRKNFTEAWYDSE